MVWDARNFLDEQEGEEEEDEPASGSQSQSRPPPAQPPRPPTDAELGGRNEVRVACAPSVGAPCALACAPWDNALSLLRTRTRAAPRRTTRAEALAACPIGWRRIACGGPSRVCLTGAQVRRRGGGSSRGREYEARMECGFDGDGGSRDPGDWDEYYSKEVRKGKGGSNLLVYGGACVTLGLLALGLTATALADEEESVFAASLRLMRLA